MNVNETRLPIPKLTKASIFLIKVAYVVVLILVFLHSFIPSGVVRNILTGMLYGLPITSAVLLISSFWKSMHKPSYTRDGMLTSLRLLLAYFPFIILASISAMYFGGFWLN